MWRGLMLTKAVEQFLRDVHWGELDYLFIDMPPGTGDVQMGLARMLPRTDLLIVTTPALAAQKVAARAADMARRSFLRVSGVIENMSAFTCDHGQSYALFGEGGGQALADQIGVPLLGQVPLEPAVSAGGDAGAPVALDGTGAAADVFRAIARRIVDDIAPPTNMAGCSARMLNLVNEALAAQGRRRRPAQSQRVVVVVAGHARCPTMRPSTILIFGRMHGGVPTARAAAIAAATSACACRNFRLATVGGISCSSPALELRERVGRTHPHAGDGLVVVVVRGLARRAGGHEEAGVEAAGGLALRRDPVAHPRQRVGGSRRPCSAASARTSTVPSCTPSRCASAGWPSSTMLPSASTASSTPHSS